MASVKFPRHIFLLSCPASMKMELCWCGLKAVEEFFCIQKFKMFG